MELRNKRTLVAVTGVAIIAIGLIAMAVANAQVGRNRNTDLEVGWLGVYIQNIDRDLAESEKLPSTDGVLVSGVVDDSPAEDAGLAEGDVILEFDGKEARSVRRLTSLIEDTKPGTKVNLRVWRDGAEKLIPVEIGEDRGSRNWSFNFNPPDVDVVLPKVPRAPSAPHAPGAPHAWGFSLGQLSTSHIGVALYDLSDQLAKHYGVESGALINEVVEDGPAEKAGLMAGDVIVEVDHKKVDNTEDIRRAIQEKEDGDKVTIMVVRGTNEQKTVDVTVETDDTWSGIGAPRRFRMRNDNADMPGWSDEWRESMLENRDAWREELQEQMRELREQLRELREELRDNR